MCARLTHLARFLTANQKVPGSIPGLVEGWTLGDLPSRHLPLTRTLSRWSSLSSTSNRGLKRTNARIVESRLTPVLWPVISSLHALRSEAPWTCFRFDLVSNRWLKSPSGSTCIHHIYYNLYDQINHKITNSTRVLIIFFLQKFKRVLKVIPLFCRAQLFCAWRENCNFWEISLFLDKNETGKLPVGKINWKDWNLFDLSQLL